MMMIRHQHLTGFVSIEPGVGEGGQTSIQDHQLDKRATHSPSIIAKAKKKADLYSAFNYLIYFATISVVKIHIFFLVEIELDLDLIKKQSIFFKKRF